MSDDDWRQTARALGLAFDEQFQRAPTEASDDPDEGLLLIGAAGHRLAIPILDTAGVHRCPPITPVPSVTPALLGVVGVHGAVVAAYGLARLLDLGDPPPGPWLVIRAADRSTGLVVDELTGLVRLPRSEIRSGRVTIGPDRRTVVRLGAVLERTGLPPTLGRG